MAVRIGVSGSSLVSANGILESLDVAATECLHFAAQFEVSGDRVIVQDAEAVDDGEGFARPLDNVFGLQFQVRLVRYGEDDRLRPVQCGLEILLDTKVLEVFLGAEKPGP